MLCWGCSFSKLEQTHEDKYLLSTKKESFSQEEDMGNRRAKHTIDKDLSFIHGGAIQSMENKWALMILTDKPSKVKSGHCSNIFLFSFCKNIIDLLGGQINDTLRGKRYSLQFHPATPLSRLRTLEGLF